MKKEYVKGENKVAGSYMADLKMFEYYAKIRAYCPNCGHSCDMPINIDKKVCTWCGSMIYRTKEIEFKEKLKKAQIKEKKQ